MRAQIVATGLAMLCALLPGLAGRAPANAAEDGQDSWQQLARRIESTLRTGRPALQIGNLDGDSHEVFGKIGRVIVDPVMGVFVLDEQALALRGFDLSGGHLGSAGGAGGGPGEFRRPVDMLMDGGKQLHVLDSRLSRISIITFAAGAARAREVRLELPGDSFCLLNDNYYLLTPADSTVIRQVDRTGALRHSFAPQVNLIRYTNVSQNAAFSFRAGENRGRLLCEAGRGLIVHVHNAAGLIRAFRSTGELAWESKLRDFHQVRYTPVQGGRFYAQTGDPKSGTASFITEAVLLTNDVLAVTLVDRRLLKGSRSTQELRLVALSDGRELRRISTELTLTAIHNNRLYAYMQEPYPRILVFDF